MVIHAVICPLRRAPPILTHTGAYRSGILRTGQVGRGRAGTASSAVAIRLKYLWPMVFLFDRRPTWKCTGLPLPQFRPKTEPEREACWVGTAYPVLALSGLSQRKVRVTNLAVPTAEAGHNTCGERNVFLFELSGLALQHACFTRCS